MVMLNRLLKQTCLLGSAQASSMLSVYCNEDVLDHNNNIDNNDNSERCYQNMSSRREHTLERMAQDTWASLQGARLSPEEFISLGSALFQHNYTPPKHSLTLKSQCCLHISLYPN